MVAQVGRATLRQVDIFARFGGEEFVVALPESSQEQALLVAERLRQIVAATPVNSFDPPLKITLSMGVADQDPIGVIFSHFSRPRT